MARARILIRPKAGILDPQGTAVQEALPRLGFDGVSDVRVGRLVELDVDDPSGLEAMCERLLANPLVEDVEIQVDDEDGARDAPGATAIAPDDDAPAEVPPGATS